MKRRALFFVPWAPLAQAQAQAPLPVQSGDVLLMRHALAPGGGDPPGLVLGDCRTQRNLSDEGRAQARAIGERLRALPVPVTALWASPWCRTQETARLAFPELPLQTQPAFGSFFSERERGAAQTREARRLLDTWRGAGVLLVVTHQVNITALTEVFPASGEAVHWRRGAVLGRWLG